MRIAVFHDLPSGGAKRALYEQVKGLGALGHRVDAYLPSTAEEGFLPLAEVASGIRVFPRPAPPDRERALEGKASPLDPLRWLRYLARVRRSEGEIAREINAGGYDVVLVGASQFTQAPWILRRLRTPSLYYCQEPLRAAYEPRIAPPATRFAIRHTLGRVDRRNLLAATAVAANSRFSARNIREIYGRTPRVLYLGVDTERFRPLPVEPGGFLLAVGGLHPLKGLDFLVEALGRVPAAHRLPLVVVSDRSRTAEERRIRELARTRRVAVELRFRVPEEELVRLYNRARLVVYAPYDEPFGFVPLEAMACGRPVLGVREGGIPETVREGETGYLAERDAARFAARLVEILEAPEAAEHLARRALGRVREEWRWERSVAGLAELCADIAARDEG